MLCVLVACLRRLFWQYRLFNLSLRINLMYENIQFEVIGEISVYIDVYMVRNICDGGRAMSKL